MWSTVLSTCLSRKKYQVYLGSEDHLEDHLFLFLFETIYTLPIIIIANQWKSPYYFLPPKKEIRIAISFY